MHQGVMCVLEMCYPQYWLIDALEATHLGHIAKLKTFYEIAKKLWVLMDIKTNDVEEQAPPPLGIYNLEFHISFFKITIITNVQVALSCPQIKTPCYVFGTSF